MATTLSTAARNAACDAVTALVNVGGAGKLVLKSAADAVLCTITLATTAFGAASVGVATASGLPKSGTGAAAAGAGTACTKFDVQNNASTVVWNGTVTGTGGGGDITLDNVSIAENQAVSITSWTHTQPAS